VKLESKGKKKRKLKTRGWQEVELVREYGVCPQCGRGIFPLDEELELLPGKLTPQAHEELVRLAGWMPFEKAVELFGDFTGIVVSKGVGRNCAEQAGAAYVEMQTEEAAYLEQKTPPASGRGGQTANQRRRGDGAALAWRVGGSENAGHRGSASARVRVGEWVVHTRNVNYFFHFPQKVPRQLWRD
jgi:hypothetical protein